MRWIKAKDFKFQDRQVYFGRRTFTDELGEKIVKGSGSFSDGAFFWKGLNEPPVGEKYYHELEILDESTPASAVEEAEKLYPYHSFLRHDTTDKLRQAHITCAGMYTDTIEKLKAENAELRKQLQNIKEEHDFKNKPLM